MCVNKREAGVAVKTHIAEVVKVKKRAQARWSAWRRVSMNKLYKDGDNEATRKEKKWMTSEKICGCSEGGHEED